MKVLVIGSGGREHAIVWKLKQSPNVSELYCAPGNAGINLIANEVKIKAEDNAALLDFVKSSGVDFTVVGPEVPLELGIVDEFSKNGLKIFGASKSASRLENSKVFAKDFMKKYGIPTAKFETFNSGEAEKVFGFLKSTKCPIVIKADGLAAGKGVVICQNEEEAAKAITDFFGNRIFGAAGEKIVIEEFLRGNEASVFAICDGENYIVLPPAQDHKKIGDGETGKNTGGMGSFAPAKKAVSEDILNKIKQRIIEPVLGNMKSEGNEFKGCLYCGLMIDESGNPVVVEFNTRFGDPEAQVVLPLVKSDFFELLYASQGGSLNNYKLEITSDYYNCVVLASKGYPDKYETGKEITGLDEVSSDCIVFHAGTKSDAGRVLTSGGRVLNIVGKSGKDLKSAIEASYKNAEVINFENKYYRRDIGQKGL
ncbi:MAG: phosphoribosylamine--glycine ligase [Chlorobi bacterium]|nr:phosphoribosylamine--glycine ligase [Chlorobiota bacterium]MCI0714991.1 phosphoribosylamine--glycine ligase [Chlorobiota bacterium]